MHSHSSPAPLRADVVVVGAGIVGLAHAWHAVRAGLSVVVVDRDDRAVGASVRNFGHICTTAQSGRAREYAVVARETWLRAGAEAGLAVSAHGTVVAARSVAEMAVLDEFASGRDRDEVRVLGADETADRLGWAVPGLVGGALMPRDLRVDSPAAVPALTAHLARLGVVFRFGENVVDVVDGVRTTHGSYVADTVIVCVGHDVDRLFPVLASDGEVRRCRLRMMEIDPPRGVRIDPGVFTGSSLLRYGGFAETAAADTVRAELASLDPDMLTHTVNLMCTQRPDGRVVIGDTHHYERTLDPFDDEALDALLLDRFCGLFGVDDLVVRRRWRGVYAASAQGPYLHASPRADVVVASVTSGIGMTTAFGFARDVLAQRGLIP